MIVGVDTNKNEVVTIVDWAKSVSEVRELPINIIAVEAPYYVGIEWTYSQEDGSFSPPYHPCEQYDWTDHRFYHHGEYRRILHNRTSDDTLEAYRKLRQGDQTIDWQAWLDTLDAYNVAIEDTKSQEGYPLKVTYPEYPTKPTPQS